MPISDRRLLIIAMLTVAPACAAQTTPAGPPPPACAAPEFHQFDFWIGSWIVRDTAGNQIGTSEITSVARGCGIREEWTDSYKLPGTSLNYYEPSTKRWNQDWVGGGGLIAHIHGGLDGKAMVLTSDVLTSPQGPYITRIAWTPLADGRVEQRWTMSTDAGKSWRVQFLGLYSRKGPG